jgi:hypothetical protein
MNSGRSETIPAENVVEHMKKLLGDAQDKMHPHEEATK